MKENTQEYEILLEYFKSENFVGLVEYCNSKIEFEKHNHLYFGARGKAYYELGEYGKAVEDLSRALELSPTYSIGLYNRGLCYYDTEEYELAIKDLENAKLLNSELESVDFYLGGSHGLLEDYDKAIAYFTLHLADYEDKVALLWRADIYYLIEQFENANNDYAAILLLESEDMEGVEALNKPAKAPISLKYDGSGKFSFDNHGFSILRKEDHGSGIYVLEFLNNEYYVGQAKKIQTRVRAHLKSKNDIRSIYYKPVTENLLLDEENFAISVLEKHGLRIRNLKQIEFLNIFSEDDQEKWIEDVAFNVFGGIRFDNNAIREKFAERYMVLKEKPYYETLVPLLSKFLKLTIPNYIASEFNYWNITCLPKYLKKSNCIVRININAVPLLSIFEESNHSLMFMIYASKLPYMRFLKDANTLKPLFDLFPRLKIDLRNAFEERTEGDEITLLVDGLDFQDVLDNQLVLSSIRLFTLRMMNRTGKEEKYRRSISHCLDLSDAIIDRIAL